MAHTNTATYASLEEADEAARNTEEHALAREAEEQRVPQESPSCKCQVCCAPGIVKCNGYSNQTCDTSNPTHTSACHPGSANLEQRNYDASETSFADIEASPKHADLILRPTGGTAEMRRHSYLVTKLVLSIVDNIAVQPRVYTIFTNVDTIFTIGGPCDSATYILGHLVVGSAVYPERL